MDIRFLPDEPITDAASDSLQCAAFVRLIHSSLQHTQTPFVYGVLGDWGTGKTSVLRLLEQSLHSAKGAGPRFLPIWFNAWKYENEANMVYPLLHAIKQHYDQAALPGGDPDGFQKRFLRVVGASALALTDLGLRALTKLGTGESLSLEDVTKHFKTVEKEMASLSEVLGEWTDKIAQIETTFQALIDLYAQDYAQAHGLTVDRVRFVILIDDLDRCLPERAIALLEGIKNFLAVRKCIFVLGLNPEVVYAGIQVKYRGLKINGREYLEKILNYSFYVPEPDLAAVEQFGAAQLKNLVLEPAAQNQWQPCFVQFGQTLQECRFTNPRKIKRILNRYLLFLAKYEATLGHYVISNIVKLHILAEYFPDLFQLYLTEGKAEDQLRHLGTDQFDLAAFQRDTGLSLAGIYALLTRMSALFRLTKPLPADGKADLRQHAAAVFAIARLK